MLNRQVIARHFNKRWQLQIAQLVGGAEVMDKDCEVKKLNFDVGCLISNIIKTIIKTQLSLIVP